MKEALIPMIGSHRQVDVAGDDDEDHRQHHQTHFHEIGGGARKIAGIQEIRREAHIEHNNQKDQRHQHPFPALEIGQERTTRRVLADQRGRFGFGVMEIVRSFLLSSPTRLRKIQLSETTAIKINKPCAASCQNGEMRINVSEFWMIPSNKAPSKTPGTVPTPPLMLTPPTTEAATV